MRINFGTKNEWWKMFSNIENKSAQFNLSEPDSDRVPSKDWQRRGLNRAQSARHHDSKPKAMQFSAEFDVMSLGNL